MVFRFSSAISKNSFARYRAGVAIDRLTIEVDATARRSAAKWALAWMRVATSADSRMLS